MVAGHEVVHSVGSREGVLNTCLCTRGRRRVPLPDSVATSSLQSRRRAPTLGFGRGRAEPEMGSRWAEAHDALAAGQAVAELACCRQGRRTGRQEAQLRKLVGGDLEHTARMGQLVHGALRRTPRATFAPNGRTTRGRAVVRPHWQVAIEELGVGQAACQHGLARAPCPSEPGDGHLAPDFLQSLAPDRGATEREPDFTNRRLFVKCGFTHGSDT